MDAFYFTQHSCSIAALSALVECDHPFVPQKLQMTVDGAGESWYANVSPLRQVPVLETAAGYVRETGAIFEYLSQRYGSKPIFAQSEGERVLMLQWLGFFGGTVHPMFRPLFRPDRFVGQDPSASQRLKEYSKSYLEKALAAIDKHLIDRAWVLDRPTVLDFYLFAFTRWAVLLRFGLPPALSGFHERVGALESVARALERERTTGVAAA